MGRGVAVRGTHLLLQFAGRELHPGAARAVRSTPGFSQEVAIAVLVEHQPRVLLLDALLALSNHGHAGVGVVVPDLQRPFGNFNDAVVPSRHRALLNGEGKWNVGFRLCLRLREGDVDDQSQDERRQAPKHVALHNSSSWRSLAGTRALICRSSFGLSSWTRWLRLVHRACAVPTPRETTEARPLVALLRIFSRMLDREEFREFA